MPRPPSVYYDNRAGCWATSALGEIATTSKGKTYRKKAFARDLTHPTKDRRKAEAWLADGLRQLESETTSAVTEGPTLDQVTEWYLETAETDLNTDTFETRTNLLDRVRNWPTKDSPERVGAKRLSRLQPNDVKRLLHEWKEAGFANSSITTGLLGALKRLTSWASSIEPGVHPGLPIPDPIRTIKGPNRTRRETRDFDPVVVSRFLRWSRRHWGRGDGVRPRFAEMGATLLLTIRETGCRPKELVVAEWEDWEFSPGGWGVIRLPAWKWKNGKKKGRPRDIAIPPGCARKIERLRAREGRHPTRIFTRMGRNSGMAGLPFVEVDHARKKTGKASRLQAWFIRLRHMAEREGISLPEGFTLYWFRSAYGTDGLRGGVSPVMLAETMGTSPKMLAKHYTDLLKQDVLATAKTILAHRDKGRGRVPSDDSGTE